MKVVFLGLQSLSSYSKGKVIYGTQLCLHGFVTWKEPSKNIKIAVFVQIPPFFEFLAPFFKTRKHVHPTWTAITCAFKHRRVRLARPRCPYYTSLNRKWEVLFLHFSKMRTRFFNSIPSSSVETRYKPTHQKWYLAQNLIVRSIGSSINIFYMKWK